MHRFTLHILILIIMAASISSVDGSPPADSLTDAWTATDALGRKLPGYEECGPPRDGKYVGIFYFLWLGSHGYDQHRNPPEDGGVYPKELPEDQYDSPYDISRMLAEKPEDPEYGPVHAFHHWGEPHLGYYLSDDEFVFAKHAQMLADIGVDVLFLDVTNAETYRGNYLRLFKVLYGLKARGQRVPQIAFLVWSKPESTVQKLWDEFYFRKVYPDLWFEWKGKPLILAPKEAIPEDLKDFFTVRTSWAWSPADGWYGDGKDNWPWVDHTPQAFGWHDDPTSPEQMAVAVSQHATSNIGRSFQNGKQPPPEKQQPAKGLYFQEQWDRALEADPELIFVTGWNEWVAMRFLSNGSIGFLGEVLPEGESYFVDNYNHEYSRDIEPMRGGHGDNYYYQLAANIRRFKGIRHEIGYVYHDNPLDNHVRNHPGWGSAGPYTNKPARNDISQMTVGKQRETVYVFSAYTSNSLTKPDGDQWMRLYIDKDNNYETGWNGYDLLINRSRVENKASIEHWDENKWEMIGAADMKISSNAVHLLLPRKMFTDPEFSFKCTDNMPDSGNILDWIDNGDAAPPGRFNYVFRH